MNTNGCIAFFAVVLFCQSIFVLTWTFMPISNPIQSRHTTTFQANDDTKIPGKVIVYYDTNCQGLSYTINPNESSEKFCDECMDFCHKQYDNDMELLNNVKSIIVYGDIIADIHGVCCGSYDYTDTSYSSTIFPVDGCVNIFGGSHLKFHNLKDGYKSTSSVTKSAAKKYNVVFSAEASAYMGYQSVVNYVAFQNTQSKENGKITRLLTSGEMDDIAEIVPTFQAKRHPFSLRYSPLNKADSLVKWFEYASPTDEVIVLIDPDNWLTLDLMPWVEKVKKGSPVAQAAWFFGMPKIGEMWREVCEKNCDWKTDDVAVPIFIHRDDLARLAPVWRYYTLILENLAQNNPTFAQKYKGIQIGWGAEMLAYVAAAAHLSLRHDVIHNLQIRDVDDRRSDDYTSKIPMIHSGRAWVDPKTELAKKYAHTEGKDFSHFGQQVWCKCNYTAAEIVPWPLPTDSPVDFVSYHTLTLLHQAFETYGKVLRKQSKYRKFGKDHYGRSFP